MVSYSIESIRQYLKFKKKVCPVSKTLAEQVTKYVEKYYEK